MINSKVEQDIKQLLDIYERERADFVSTFIKKNVKKNLLPMMTIDQSHFILYSTMYITCNPHDPTMKVIRTFFACPF